MGVLQEIVNKIFDNRGFVREKADRVAEALSEFGVRYGITSRSKPEFRSGMIRGHGKKIRIYGGNTIVTSRRDGRTYYIYPYLEIPCEAIKNHEKEILEKLKSLDF